MGVSSQGDRLRPEEAGQTKEEMIVKPEEAIAELSGHAFYSKERAQDILDALGIAEEARTLGIKVEDPWAVECVGCKTRFREYPNSEQNDTLFCPGCQRQMRFVRYDFDPRGLLPNETQEAGVVKIGVSGVSLASQIVRSMGLEEPKVNGRGFYVRAVQRQLREALGVVQDG